jgi:hypothetical protein
LADDRLAFLDCATGEATRKLAYRAGKPATIKQISINIYQLSFKSI